ncbi:hypothetical protein, partial [Halobacillus sp. BBL2006]|uniref:hypothetical protein n=1 Tax=Halobacillus sp. BBL2006 TaxID=1543706 RepID=UPI001E41FDF5
DFLLMTRVSGRCSWTSCFPPNPNKYLATEPKVSRNQVLNNSARLFNKSLTAASEPLSMFLSY